MPLLSIWPVIVGIFGAAPAFFSSTGQRVVLHVHPTPQMWTASVSTVINGSKCFPLLRQFWKNSRFSAVSTNGRGSVLGYSVADIDWNDHESFHLKTCQAVSRKGGSPVELSSVATNSGEALTGGSCGGGLLLLCIVIYILYKCLKDDPSVHPATGNAPQQDTRAHCPHCRIVPSSAPPAYNEVFPMEECTFCMSAPPANSKHHAIRPSK